MDKYLSFRYEKYTCHYAKRIATLFLTTDFAVEE